MSMDNRPEQTDRSGCGSTRHCADHGWCHRCAPERSEAEAKARAAIAPLEKAVRAAKAQERAEIRNAALLEGADAVYALTFDECGRADTEFDSFQHAWDLGTIDATHTLRRLAGRTEALADKPKDGDISRFPISRSVRYAVRSAPEVPDEYNETRTIAPTEVTFTYRAAPDGQLGRVHAYVKGWWMQDGARVHAEAVGRHFHGDLAGWPEWLAAEARLHDPETVDEELTLAGALEIVESWFVDVNDGHGFDASDLVHQLAEAGYQLPSDGPS